MKTLRNLREDQNWSQSELARRAGIHSSTISLIENGRLKPYDAQIDKIAQALGTSRNRIVNSLSANGKN